MNALIRAAADLQAVCVGQGWRFCFIGGMAVQRWGEPRETIDVDLTLLTGFSDVSAYVTTLLASFEPRVENVAEFKPRLDRTLRLRAIRRLQTQRVVDATPEPPPKAKRRSPKKK